MAQTRQGFLGAAKVYRFVRAVFFAGLHAKRVLSLSQGTLGVMHAAKLGVSVIGRALAAADGLSAKHAIKQVDRLLSNTGISMAKVFALWVPFVVGSRSEIVVALDWTEYDHDDQVTLALHLVTRHGRATPLMWKTVRKSRLRGRRNAYEDELLGSLYNMLPLGVDVTVLADRGFGDAALYAFHRELDFDHIIRFRGDVTVTDAAGESRPARAWLHAGGRARIMRNVRVTGRKHPVAAVVCVWAKGMKEPWFLACGARSARMMASQVVARYARRFTIEESFRDLKDQRFGKGLSSMRIGTPARRDRLLLLSALATALLTLLGAAGEILGFDRLLRANTAKRRTHSLFFQGCQYHAALPNMRTEQRDKLMTAFAQLLHEHPVFKQVFGLL